MLLLGLQVRPASVGVAGFACGYGSFPQILDGPLAHLFRIVWAHAEEGVRAASKAERLGSRCCLFLFRDHAHLAHFFEHQVPSCLGAARMEHGRVPTRGTSQGRKKRHLGQVDLVQSLVEVSLGSGSDAIGTVAQEDFV